MANNSPTPTRIIVVGGGFGGVKTALLLSRSQHFQIQLISDRDHFAYYPQLYHTVTGGSPLASWLPLSELFRDNPRVEVIIGRMDNLDPEAQTIWCADGRSLAYDSLVLALGNVTNYFGIAGMAEYSYGMKSLDEALELKHHLHHALTDRQEPDPHYVIVGAGPTGVELAAALTDYVRTILRGHGITSSDYRIDLVEAAPRILPRSSEAYSAKVAARLVRLGVNVMVGKTVKATTATEVTLDGESLATRTVVWTAGVANNPFYASHPDLFATNAKSHKVTVNEYLEARPNIYVIGDNADTEYSGLALTAVNDAKFLASHFDSIVDGAKCAPYVPKSPMTVIPVGNGWAAFNYRSLNLYGLVGWILRRAGDWVAYRDIARLVPATKYWLADSVVTHECPTCDFPHKRPESHATS